MAQEFVDIDKIEDALLADIKANLASTLGLKTIDTFEQQYENKESAARLVVAPFVLLYYYDGVPVQKESGLSTIKIRDEFHFYVGSHNLRDKRGGQKGCYSILNELRKRYDGGVLAIDSPAASVVLSMEGRGKFVSSEGGIIVYVARYSIHQ